MALPPGKDLKSMQPKAENLLWRTNIAVCVSHLISPGGPGKEKKGENPTRAPNSQPDPAPDRTSPHRHTARPGQSDESEQVV